MEVYQDLDSDRYLFPSEKVFDNAADDLEVIAVSKRSKNRLPQKKAVRTHLKPFCHSPGLAQSNLPKQTEKDVKDVNSEIVMKRRVRIFLNINFQNFDWSWDISQKCKNGHVVQKTQ